METSIPSKSDVPTANYMPTNEALKRSGIEIVSGEGASSPLMYSCIIEPTLKDSNAYGNIYFSRYFEWQGVVREKWFSECIFENMFALEGSLITKTAHSEYLEEVFPFQKLNAFLYVKNLKFTSFQIVISFTALSGEVVARGYQDIVFADKNRKIAKIPLAVKEEISKYNHL